MDAQESSILIPVNKDIIVGAFGSDLVIIKSCSSVYDIEKAIEEATRLPYSCFKKLNEFLKELLNNIGKDKIVKQSLNCGIKLHFDGTVFQIFNSEQLICAFKTEQDSFFDFFVAIAKSIPFLLFPNQKQTEVLEYIKYFKPAVFSHLIESFKNWKAIYRGPVDVSLAFYFASAHKEVILFWLALNTNFRPKYDARQTEVTQGQ